MFRGVSFPGQRRRSRGYSISDNDHPDLRSAGHIRTIRTASLDENGEVRERISPDFSPEHSSPNVTFEVGDGSDLAIGTIGRPASVSPGPLVQDGDSPLPWKRRLPTYVENANRFNLAEVTQVTTNIISKRIYGLNKTPKNCLSSLFPQCLLLKDYKAQWILRDFLAGLIVSMIHFTQVFASSMTASMNPFRGLPLLIFPCFIYAFMTTSPHNSLGGMPITAAALSISNINIEEMFYPNAKFNDTYLLTDDDTYLIHMRISTGIAFVAGCILTALGILKLGFLSAILSPTVTDPFTIACCLQSICAQLPSMFGIQTPLRFGYAKQFQDTIYFLSNLTHVSGWSALLSIAYAVCLLGFREYLQPLIFQRFKTVVPLEFILYVAVIALSYSFNFSGVFGIRIVGVYKYGLPKPSVPAIEFGYSLIFGGVVNAIVAYSITLKTAQTLARKSKDIISPNQELLAVGVAHIFGSFFSCGMVAAPIGRGNVNQSMGSRSQLSTLFSCLIMGLVIGYAGPIISHLPVSVISTNIVLFLSMSLTGFMELPKIWRSNKFDACVWMMTFICSVSLNVQIGLIIGIGISVLGLILRSQKPKVRVLGRLKNSSGFVPLKYYEKASELVGIRIIQIQSPLHYANAQYLIQYITTIALEPYVGSVVTSIGREESSMSLSRSVHRNLSFLGIATKKDPAFRALAGQHQLGSSTSMANSEMARLSQRYHQQKQPSFNSDSRPVSPSTVSQEFILMTDQERATASRIILDLGTVGYIDAVGIRALEQLASDLKLKAVEIVLAQCKGSLLKQLRELEIHKIIPERNIFPSVVDAVDESLRRIKINTQPAEGLIGEYEDERFWDMPVIPVNGLPVIDYDID